MLQCTGKVYSARWYGKLCTAVRYIIMAGVLFWPDMSGALMNGGIALCAALIGLCLLLYGAKYLRLLRQSEQNNGDREKLLSDCMIREELHFTCYRALREPLPRSARNLLCAALVYALSDKLAAGVGADGEREDAPVYFRKLVSVRTCIPMGEAARCSAFSRMPTVPQPSSR